MQKKRSKGPNFFKRLSLVLAIALLSIVLAGSLSTQGEGNSAQEEGILAGGDAPFAMP